MKVYVAQLVPSKLCRCPVWFIWFSASRLDWYRTHKWICATARCLDGIYRGGVCWTPVFLAQMGISSIYKGGCHFPGFRWWTYCIFLTVSGIYANLSGWLEKKELSIYRKWHGRLALENEWLKWAQKKLQCGVGGGAMRIARWSPSLSHFPLLFRQQTAQRKAGKCLRTMQYWKHS